MGFLTFSMKKKLLAGGGWSNQPIWKHISKTIGSFSPWFGVKILKMIETTS